MRTARVHKNPMGQATLPLAPIPKLGTLEVLYRRGRLGKYLLKGSRGKLQQAVAYSCICSQEVTYHRR